MAQVSDDIKRYVVKGDSFQISLIGKEENSTAYIKKK